MTVLWICALALLALCVAAILGRQWLRKKLKKWLASRFITTVVVPLVAVFPPLVVTASDEKRHLWPANLWNDLRIWLDTHPAVITVALFWPMALIFGAYLLSLARRRIIELDELTAKEYGFVLHTIDHAAGKRMNRFGDATARIFKTPPELEAHNIFQTITKPLDQRSTLIDGIYHVFRLDAESREARSGDFISVKLARMKNGLFAGFEAWLPADQSPNSGPEQLSSKECSLFRAAVTRAGIIIENIESELSKTTNRQFVAGALGSSVTGSLISFPVLHQPTHDVPYVVTVRSEKSGHFRENRRARYYALLRPFLIRISIEHSISLLKEYHERVRY
jgi:hypothetical protein